MKRPIKDRDVLNTANFHYARCEIYMDNTHLSVKPGCMMYHRSPIGECGRAIVYEIPLACGHVYVDQMGRYINESALEHRRNVENNSPLLILASHLSQCNNCYPCWGDGRDLDVDHDMRDRIIRGTLRIVSAGNCISTLSMSFDLLTRSVWV